MILDDAELPIGKLTNGVEMISCAEARSLIASERNAAFEAGAAAEAERCINIQVQCPQFGVASDDYLKGFEAGANAVLEAIRNPKSE